MSKHEVAETIAASAKPAVLPKGCDGGMLADATENRMQTPSPVSNGGGIAKHFQNTAYPINSRLCG